MRSRTIFSHEKKGTRTDRQDNSNYDYTVFSTNGSIIQDRSVYNV